VSPAPRAITLDLDDTLWPIAPAIHAAEAALARWLATHAPEVARRWPVGSMRALRERIAGERADLAHDYSAQRRLSLEHMLADCGADPALAAPAFDAFFDARNRVECYPDAIGALARLAARVPVAALTNGNADLARIGLAGHFRFSLCAREHGRPKPSPCIYLAACDRLELAPHEVLHVGDDVEADVLGAARAGLATCWINRTTGDGCPREWPHADIGPDLEFPTLAALADWLDHAHAHARPLPDRSTA
jgi:FMN hydrolase / 5-amino-6-(5-phospho-D-ribitylamino)uracil phosphatase